MLKCPKCGSTNIRVVDSRNNKKHPGLYRRRMCNNCDTRWSTYECAVDEIEEFKEKILKDSRYRNNDILIG